MGRRIGSGAALVAAAALWGACAGEQYVGVDAEVACTSQRECDNGDYPLGLECIRNTCQCPREGDVLCCGSPEEPCDRRCRPFQDCALPPPGQECVLDVDCVEKLQPNPRCAEAVCEDGRTCTLRVFKEPPTQKQGDCVVVNCDAEGVDLGGDCSG